MSSNQDMQLSKTWLTFVVKDLSQSCKIYGRSGMMQNGIAYQLPPLLRLTDVIESGLWPTPLASAKSDCPSERRRQSPHLETVVKMLPTPTASDATVGDIIGKDDIYKMTSSGSIRKYTKNGTSASLGLAIHVRFFPTPTARDYKDTGDLKKLAQYVSKSILACTIAHEELNNGEQNWNQ